MKSRLGCDGVDYPSPILLEKPSVEVKDEILIYIR